MKIKKIVCSLVAVFMATFFFTSCSPNNAKTMNFGKGKQILNWNPEVVDHGSYKDLGHYVIDMGEISKQTFAAGAERANAKFDTLKTKSCTAIAKKIVRARLL